MWNRAIDRCDGIDVVVTGQRTGTHRDNVRNVDPGPAQIEFAFEATGSVPGYRTLPHGLRRWMLSGEFASPVAMTVDDEPRC